MKQTFAAALALSLALGLNGLASAHDVNHQGRPPAQADPSQVPVRVIDRQVVDQDGAVRAFGRDVVGERLVVVDFIYTDCVTLCPLQSSIMADLQDKLGDRIGRDITLVSLTVDPVNDRPARLKVEAERFGAKPGWRFLTGDPKDVEVILTGMQAWVARPEDHPGYFLIGSARQGSWTKLDGLPSPEQLLAVVNAATSARARHY